MNILKIATLVLLISSQSLYADGECKGDSAVAQFCVYRFDCGSNKNQLVGQNICSDKPGGCGTWSAAQIWNASKVCDQKDIKPNKVRSGSGSLGTGLYNPYRIQDSSQCFNNPSTSTCKRK
ncbi:hypothetical protein Lsha_2487 [Legionella shakespearei DSM 23087]|uniref:Secreted protein n=2 Tax=Legionella shakespearei TaxID=45075 RepID=A0A0W0YM30_9GAMM|nr:hypothetical protein Lsha_2487 [Legionella shakespearei DSM 23087]